MPGRVHLHGHCGVLAAGRLASTTTRRWRAYAEMAVAQAAAGVHMVGPSGMMDGQVGVVRAALDAAGLSRTSRSWPTRRSTPPPSTARSARRSSPRCSGDRRTYQQDPAERSARRCARSRWTSPRAPTSSWSSRRCPTSTWSPRSAPAVDVPVAAYQVSGEYAMVEAAAANGWIDRERAILETLASIRRAGAQIILTYWAVEAARLLRDRG